MYIGMDSKDRTKGRLDSPRANWGKLGVQVVYPLIEWGSDVNAHEYIKATGIKPPRTYAEGFSNANCLEQGCVKQGAKGWINLTEKRSQAFYNTAVWEWDMRQKPETANHAMLSKTVDGVDYPYPLTQLFSDYCKALELARTAPRQLSLFHLDMDEQSVCAVDCGVHSYEGDIE
jgi:hypothetical protein